MKALNRLKTAIFAGAMSLAALTPAWSQSDDPGFAMNARIGRGINVGTDWEKATAEDYAAAKKAGFASVRLLVKWPEGASEQGSNKISADYFSAVDKSVQEALDAGLVVVLTMEGFGKIEFPGNPDREETLAQVTDRYMDTWRQVAEHYAKFPPELTFELLNEPINVLGPKRLNALYAEVIKLIRENNRQRTLIVGGECTYSYLCLETLKLPERDRNLVVAIHNYLPPAFTLQLEPGRPWGKDIMDDFNLMAQYYAIYAWSERNDRPVTINEFGSMGKADTESRARFASTNARMAEMMGFSWMYFNFLSPNAEYSSFGIYHHESKAWQQPLLEALVPSNASTDVLGPGVPGMGAISGAQPSPAQ